MDELIRARKVGMDLYNKWVEIKNLAENYHDHVVREKLSDFLESLDEWIKFIDVKLSNVEEKTSKMDRDITKLKSDVRELKLKL